MSNQQFFTPQVQDSNGQSHSKHFDKESRDYLPSHSHEDDDCDDDCQKMIVMMVLIDLPIIKFTCQHHVYVCCV